MKSNVNTVLVLIAIAIASIALAKVSSLKSEQKEPLQKQENILQNEDDEHLELAVYMDRMQRHFSKLYYAAKANNLPLAKFYVQEINESFETIIDANVVDDGHNISALAKQFGEGPFERIENDLEENGLTGFDRTYDDLILNCNSCHVMTEHAFVKIVVPKAPPVGNQSFTFSGQ
ncbi:MAG: hypothetical protein HKN39_08475 [Flavobacteriales bacterium]|nr:hypothetical protein [Flavobacteriales bacterium]